MFQNMLIDIAIGLMVMYLVLSLFCTMLNEFIATKLKLRSSLLQGALKELLDNPDLRDKFYNHGLIAGNKEVAATGPQTTLTAIKAGAVNAATAVSRMVSRAPASMQIELPTKSKVSHPSYLSGETVALAILGSLDKSKPVPGFADLSKAIEGLGDSKIRDALYAALSTAQNDVTKLRDNIASWFDDSMDRLSGAYKRHLKWISLLVGLLVALLVNADTLAVTTALWKDPKLRDQMVDVATKIPPETPKAGDKPDYEAVRKAFDDLQAKLQPLPIGWRFAEAPNQASLGWWDWIKSFVPNNVPATWWERLLKVIGLIITAAALSLGAPFWFDLLQKAVNLRGAGAKPPRQDEKKQK
jgi:hypothetical protein